MTHFPISHIDDVLPHIQGRTDFIVAHRDGYSVIDYVYALPDSFDHPARLECRGLKFAPDGHLIARPLHKFFNVGEKPHTQADVLDFTTPHVVMDKLDGSMINAAIVNGDVVFMTRMGRTDVALKAERHLTPRLAASCRGMLEDGVTPIFEWTAPENRIVVRYPDDRLTLLALRDTRTGYYWSQDWVPKAARDMGIGAVDHHEPSHTSAADFLAYARAVQGVEGFVVRFESGLWVKAKGEDYVLKHKAKDSILQEKNILALVLSGGLDDVLPLLDGADAAAALAYSADVVSGIEQVAMDIDRRVAANSNLAPREFATEFVTKLPAHLQAPAYQIRRGAVATDVIRARIAANTNTQTQVDQARPLHGARWDR